MYGHIAACVQTKGVGKERVGCVPISLPSVPEHTVVWIRILGKNRYRRKRKITRKKSRVRNGRRLSRRQKRKRRRRERKRQQENIKGRTLKNCRGRWRS
jgi:hypothetical protein